MACPLLPSGCNLSVGFGELFGQRLASEALWDNVWGLRLNGGQGGQEGKGGGAVSPWEPCCGRIASRVVEWMPCCCFRWLEKGGKAIFLCSTPGDVLLAGSVGVLQLL